MHLPCLDFYHRMSLTPLAGQRPGQPSLQATRRHFHIKVQRSPCVLCRMTCDHNTLTPLKFWCTWHMGGQACTVGGAKLRKRFCDPWWQRATKFPHFSGRSTLATQTDWNVLFYAWRNPDPFSPLFLSDLLSCLGHLRTWRLKAERIWCARSNSGCDS